MTPSNPFRINPGPGTVRLSAAGGSANLRSIGIGSLIGGLLVSTAGAALYGYGRFEERDGLITAGAAGLILGGVAVVGSLPLLMMGATTVRDARGHTIAGGSSAMRF